jgi:hypothetical protein
MMLIIIAGMTAVIIVCFIITVGVSCENLFSRDTDTAQQNEEQDDPVPVNSSPHKNLVKNIYKQK